MCEQTDVSETQNGFTNSEWMLAHAYWHLVGIRANKPFSSGGNGLEGFWQVFNTNSNRNHVS
jgi:hypothetical protein